MNNISRKYKTRNDKFKNMKFLVFDLMMRKGQSTKIGKKVLSKMEGGDEASCTT